MSASERIASPLDFDSPSDNVVHQALDRQRELHRQWREAQTAAIEAQQAIARARADDEQRRAAALADGDADPGAPSLAKYEKAAVEAAGLRDVLRLAYVRARARALDLANEREHEWQQATAARLDAARAAIAPLVEQLEQLFIEYVSAWTENSIASSEVRERGRTAKVAARAPRLPQTLDEWRGLAARPQTPVLDAV